MADFSYLSDTDDSAVEEILAEAADHVALKQVAAINLSGVSDSVLPQHLDSRFRRLKTFPSKPEQPSGDGAPPKLAGETGAVSAPAPAEYPKAKPISPCSSLSSSPDSWLEGRNSGKVKSERGFESGRRSPEKVKRGGCLWWSPGKARRKKRSGGGGKGDVLEDAGWFTKKDQERMMRKAAKEEMKVNKEAEKIVKWAKQVSARMEGFGVEDDHLPHKRH